MSKIWPIALVQSSCAHATVFLGSRRIVCTFVAVVDNPGSSPVLRNAAGIASAPLEEASETGFAEDSATLTTGTARLESVLQLDDEDALIFVDPDIDLERS